MVHQLIPKRLTMPETRTVPTTHRNDYADMIWGLQIDGYQRSARLNEIDAAVIAELGCDVCGGPCRYEAWRRQRPRGYRALSICRDCGCVNEV